MNVRVRWSIFAWLVYAVVHVGVSGAVLDETVIAGQVIAGDVVYPAGHPHDVYFKTTFSLSHFVSAAVLRAGFDVESASFLRNVLFLFLSAVTPFLAALALTRRVVVGHAATVLTLLGAAASLGGLYPVWVFPDFYSNGHVGLCLAVCLVAVTSLGWWRTAGLLFGLLPSLHGAMALAAWAALALVSLMRLRRGEGIPPRRFFVGAAAGGAVSLGLGVYLAFFTTIAPAAPPFETGLATSTVRETLMVTGHRGAIPWSHVGYWLNPVLFAAAAALVGVLARRRDDATRRALEAFLILGAVGWLIVVAMDVWRRVGSPPEALVILMPGRFSNLTQALLVPLAAAAVYHGSRALPPRRRLFLGAGLGVTLAGLALAASGVLVDGGGPVARHALPLVLGAAVGLGVLRWKQFGGGRRAVLAAAALAVAGSQIPLWASGRMALYSLVAVGAVAATGVFAGRWSHRIPAGLPAVARVAPLVAAAVVAAATVQGRRVDFMDPSRVRWDVVSDDDRALRRWFEQYSDRDDLVLTPWVWRLPEAQGKYGRPVLVKFETPWFSTYRPDLAPMIDVLVEELYGVEFPPPGRYGEVQGDPTSVWNPVWERAWTSRSAEEWRRLSDRFGFRHVVAPSNWTLSLDAAFVGPEFSIYVIG